MRVVFRVDASLAIGTGHVIRCLTLAKVLRENGANIDFICRQHEGNFINKIRSDGFNVFELSYSKESKVDDKLSHSHWLGATQQKDAKDSIAVLGTSKTDWLVVDHYAIDEDWQQVLKPYYCKLMVIDDLADRKHQCDLLLDQNLFENMSIRYLHNTPSQCVKLLGPEYALLQPEYAELRKEVTPRTLPIKRLLVFFGGVDHYNITELTLDVVNKMPASFETIDVVLSTNSLHYDVIKRHIANYPNIHLHSDLPTLAPLMARADLSIGAGGSTNWERFCLGLPSIVVTLANNQVLVNQCLKKMGLIELVGDVSTITRNLIYFSIKKILFRGDLQGWSESCLSTCLGNGCMLVSDVMFEICDSVMLKDVKHENP